MKKINIFLLLISPMLTRAQQDTGVHFQHKINWQAVQAQAKASHKYIFIDCFTTWCGPCKYMSTTIFPMQSVGEFMNDKFVSVAVQLDTTKNDDENVKAWYKDGHDIAAKYKVRNYPTYLIFDENGNIVHRFIGSSEAKEFIANAKKSLDPSTQYYTVLKQYNNGNREATFLRNAVLATAAAYDMENTTRIFNDYIPTQKDVYTKENLELIQKITFSSSDKGFDIVLKNQAKVDELMGKGTAASILQPVILNEEIFKKLQPTDNPDWAALNSEITKKYPEQGPEVVAKAKVLIYQYKADWANYQPAVIEYMKKYGANATPDELNNYAWTVFQNCTDMKCVAEALDWSKRSFKDFNNPAFIDTYANILYKLGKKDEALTWEKKAYDLAPEQGKQGYHDTIEKMKKNEKTWN